ncbi:MAG: HD domain-containing protein, partial [Deferribacteres bacterium]|nr:HD domain-containing protein [Deferribacteres bacterium]
MDIDVKEYNSVVLGALLHDVGKFLHRGTPGYEGKHYVASSDFIKDNIGKLKNDLYDIDLVRFLVYHHHNGNDEIENELKSNGKSVEERERILRLVKLIKDADSYSCIERDKADQDKTDKDKRRSPLDSIFSYVNLDVRKVKEESISRYPLNSLNPLRSFPADINLLSDEEIKHLINLFLNNIPDFRQYKRFDDVINVWLNLLEEYTWAVPSDTRYKISDISLFDHLKTSAAVSACLYKRHITEINSNKKIWKRQYEFVFVGGDFSGIQDYIFNITSGETAGVSKRLRARSLFITLFSEIIIHRI